MVIGTAEEVKNKIIVVSSVADTPSSLIKKLIGKDDSTFKSIYSDEIHSTDWEIDTNADVEFWLLNQPTYPPTQLSINVDKLGELCEALILVFDATKPDTFGKIHGWSQFVEEFNPNVLLCVGIGKSDNTSKHIYTEWCVANGLEYVEVVDPNESTSSGTTSTTTSTTRSTTNTSNASAPLQDDDDDEEEEEEEDRFGNGTEGKDRIIEALSATMWENMRQKARRLEDQFSSMLSLGGEDDDVEDDLALALDPSAPTFDPLDFNEDLRFARGEFRAATTEISQNLLALQSFLRETDAPHGVDGTDEAVGGEEAENNTEANVEHFESALTGLRRLRESAQQLPDAQRKALAAQVISMLFPDEEDWQ